MKKNRLITFLFVICMCIGMLPIAVNAATAPASTAKIYKWKQTDSRWNKYYDADWNTGCALTAIAIQIARTDLVRVDESSKTFNPKTGMGFNPGSFAKAWKRPKDLSVSWTSQTDVVPGFQSVTKKNVISAIDKKAKDPVNGWQYYKATNKKEICKAMKYYLDNGYYPIIEGPGSKWASKKSSVHYVAVVKATEDDVRVIDPANGKNKSLFSVNVGGGKWTPANIDKCGRYKGYGCCRLYKVNKSKMPKNLIDTSAPPKTKEEYLESCDSPTATNIYVQVTTENSNLMTLPCQTSTCELSTAVRGLVSGEKLTATAIYKNTGGKYWYKVKDSDGKTGYVYGEAVEPTGKKPPEGAVTGNASIPTLTPKYGKAQPISGTITAKNLKITQVKAWLKKTSNDEDLQYAKVTNINSKSFSFSGTKIDANLKFGKLPKGKAYIYIKVFLNAKYTDGKSLLTKEIYYWLETINFTVK